MKIFKKYKFINFSNLNRNSNNNKYLLLNLKSVNFSDKNDVKNLSYLNSCNNIINYHYNKHLKKLHMSEENEKTYKESKDNLFIFNNSYFGNKYTYYNDLLSNYKDKYLSNKIEDNNEYLLKSRLINKNEIIVNNKLISTLKRIDFNRSKYRSKSFILPFILIVFLMYIIYLRYKVLYNLQGVSFIIKVESVDKNKSKEDKSSNASDATSSSTLEESLMKMLIKKNSNFELKLDKNINTSLDEIKGIDEVKEEIQQLIRLIKNPSKYRQAGAKVPKGVLLVGKPGTGKTIIAKAIAGDSKVNFVSLTGSDFDDMFVGVGAQRIKELFEFAKNNSPCIIFIDEIDALLAKSRRTSNEHSSSRATINKFLSEMDGFSSLENVFVIGATNHEKDLDAAAVRPGRFDKKIHINIPDIKGREDIANFYLEKLKIKKDMNVNGQIISQITTGFTGAEIENLINISGINTVNNTIKSYKSSNEIKNSNQIKNEFNENDNINNLENTLNSSINEEEILSNKNLKLNIDSLTEARDRIMMGISRKYYTDMNKRRFMTSVHEIGHTLVCYLNPICKTSLLKVTIVPTGSALGNTQRMEIDDTVYSKEYLISSIDVAMGGHVAEELVFGKDNITSGCSSDLNSATKTARKMVSELGMYGNEIGYIFTTKSDEPKEEKLGEKQKEILNDKINDILKERYSYVKSQLEKHSYDLKRLSKFLYKYNYLNFDEINLILDNKEYLINREVARDDYNDSIANLNS